MEHTLRSPHPSRHTTVPWLDFDEYDRYPTESRPRRSHSRHKAPYAAESYYVRDGLLTPSSSRAVTPTSQKSRNSGRSRPRSPFTHHRRSRSPHVRYEGGRAHSPPAVLRKRSRSARRGHDREEPSTRSVLRKRSRSIHDSKEPAQASTPPATHKRVRHAAPDNERGRPSQSAPRREQPPGAVHNGPRVRLPHHRTYDANDSRDAWPVPGVTQIQHLGVGLDRPRRRRGNSTRRERDDREPDAHRDAGRTVKRRHSGLERVNPAEKVGAYEEQERKKSTPRRRTDKDPSLSDVPAYLMHPRRQIRRQAMENIKEMSRPVGHLETEQMRSQFYNGHYVYLSQRLCENMEAWLRFRVQELFKNAYQDSGALPDRDHDLMRKKSKQRAPLEDTSWTDIETSHPASCFKRVTLGRRVRKDYRALKRDLLDALGSLTPEPQLVFDCLVNGPAMMKRCYCSISRAEQTREAQAPVESKVCPHCRQQYLPPAALVDLFYQLHAPGFASTHGWLFDSSKHFVRATSRFSKFFARLQIKCASGISDKSFWSERPGQFVQCITNFVEASRYWRTGKNCARGVNAYTRLRREISERTHAPGLQSRQWVHPLDSRHYDFGPGGQ